MTKWLSRFLIFLLVVIVVISIGLTIFYFLTNDEAFSLEDGNGDNLVKYANVGETIDITVTRTNPSSEDYSLVSTDETVVVFKEMVRENVFRFEALKGGSVELQLQTTNENFQNLSITVNVGDGTTENPYYVRNYTDLASIGVTLPLTANYIQTADIDMSVATEAWKPIGDTDTNGFTGTYNGNNHKILNFTLFQLSEEDKEILNSLMESDLSDEQKAYLAYLTSLNTTEENIINAGLFAQIGYKGKVEHLNIENAFVGGYTYETAGIVAGIVYGEVNFVNVINSALSTVLSTSSVGGIAGIVSGNNGSYSARIQYSSFTGIINGGLYVGGIAGQNRAGLIFNTYSAEGKPISMDFITSSITSDTDNAKVGGIVGYNTYITVTRDFKASVVSNYSTIPVTATGANASVGAIVGANLNNDDTNLVVLDAGSDAQEEYNRIYGNYYLHRDGLNGVGGIENSTSAYLANNVLQSALMSTAPTAEQIAAMNEQESGEDATSAFNPDLAFITYDYKGNYLAWDFNNVWNIDANVNNGYPYIRSNATKISDVIYDGGDYATLPPEDPSDPDDPTDPDEPATQINLVELFERDFADDNEYNGSISSSGVYYIDRNVVLTEAWTPVGDEEHPFNATFIVEDGITISNLIINDIADTNYYGFFGFLGENARIIGLNIEGIQINLDDDNDGNTYVGVIAGKNNGGQIIGCTVNGNDTNGKTINVQNKNNVFAGGLVGENTGTISVDNTVTAKFNTVNINMSISNTKANGTLYVGGVVGSNRGTVANSGFNSELVNDAYTTTIDVRNNTNSATHLGGVVGYNYRVVQGSYFKGNLLASTNNNVYVGGIVGSNTDNATITTSGADAVITGGYYTGGIVGYYNASSSSSKNITQSYAKGSIFGKYVGGLAGNIDKGSIKDCYTLTDLSGEIMGGLAAYIRYSNSDTWGKVEYCFSAATFNLSSGTAYWETASAVRQTEPYWEGWNPIPKTRKVGGYAEKNIIATITSGDVKVQHTSNVLGGTDFGDVDDGRTSAEDCRRASTFTNRGGTEGFLTSVWNFSDNSYPTLINANY